LLLVSELSMSLRVKLVLMVAFVAIVPLAMSGIMALRVHQRAFETAVGDLHLKTAELGAAVAQRRLEGLRSSLLLTTRSIRWDQLSAAERRGALGFVFRQIDDILVAALLDEEGDGLGSSIFVDSNETEQDLARHPPASLSLLQDFARHIPFAAAQADGTALGETFGVADSPASAVPLALRVDGVHGAKWVVALALSLSSLCTDLSTANPADFKFRLIDAQGQSVCSSCNTTPRPCLDPAFVQAAKSGQSRVARFLSASGAQMLGAYAPASSGWGVAVEQPKAVAFSPSRRLFLQTGFWVAVSLVIAVLVGHLLAQGITGPVAELVKGALELAQGHFGYRLTIQSRDELGKLSQAFNTMGAEVERRDAEIRAWNEDLQKRVEERTRELKEAQEQVLQSKKIAAVSALGAGVAHEINNPLSAVLGMTQILERRLQKEADRKRELNMLGTIEAEAHRIKGIVRTLHSFSAAYAGEGFVPIDVNSVLAVALKLSEAGFAQQKIEVRADYAPSLPLVLGNGNELQQVFSHLLDNSKTAMPSGGLLSVSTESIDGQLVKVVVMDTGKGIAPEHLDKIFEPFFTTKDKWQGKGLGLTVAFRIVESHHGKIRATSKLGEGTTMTITLPAARPGAHLA
jgi:two-component system NtrC family sensor kinase